MRLDPLTPKERSKRMSLVRSKNTKPEMAVRRIAHGLGYRYRLHRNDLPGCPDLVFSRHHKIILVHGCFWHRHPKCSRNRLPKTRKIFWKNKLDGNKRRDHKIRKQLVAAGWDILVIWECETDKKESILNKIKSFLEY